MMDRERVQEVMGRVDPALIERMDPPKKRRLPRPLRTGLIAACVCLALIGTAVAATTIAGFQNIEHIQNWTIGTPYGPKAYDGIRLSGGVRYIPLEELDQCILDAAANEPGSVALSEATSPEGLSELVGISILGSQLPETMRLKSFHASVHSSDEGPTAIDFYGVYQQESGLEVNMAGTILTELMYDPDVDFWSVLAVEAKDEYEIERYQTPNGAEAVIFYQPENADATKAVLIYNGIEYVFSVTGSSEAETQEMTLKQVLDTIGI